MKYINFQLNRTDIENLLRGTTPPYEMMEELTKDKLGYYCGGFNDRWVWDLDKNVKTDEELLQIYKRIQQNNTH